MKKNVWLDQLALWIAEKRELPEELLELAKDLDEKSAAAETLIQSIQRLSQELTEEHVKR